ncbi:hypothetical protein ACFL4U_00330 [Candidatus Neomarinimicrobiota bacterium]
MYETMRMVKGEAPEESEPHTSSTADMEELQNDMRGFGKYIEGLYLEITGVYIGEWIIHPSVHEPPYHPAPTGEYGFYYRAVVFRSEIWDNLFLEKINFYDEEGGDRRVAAYKRLELKKYSPLLDTNEYCTIQSVAWIDSTKIELVVNNNNLSIDVSKEIPYNLYNGDQ